MNLRLTFPRILLILFTAIVVFSVFAAPVLAQTPIWLQVGCSGLDCQACHLANLVKAVINFLLLVAIPMATILFAYAGILYFTSAGDEGKISKAKQIFIDVFIGFILALCAWLIVDTILKVLLNPSRLGQPWYSIQCVQQVDRPGTLPGTDNKTLFNDAR